MFKHQNIWLPDGEKHFPEWMTRNGEIVDGKGTYQIKKLREAMKHVKSWRRAVDVGAHVGLWSMHLAKKFARVEAFEPMPQFRECFMANVSWGVNFELHARALGSEIRTVRMAYNPADSGDTHVDTKAETGDVEMTTLDSFGFGDVDFIKIDCEGFELEVLRGAWRTIAISKPTIIVEQKPHKLKANYGTKGAPAVDYLRDLGYVVAREMSGDYIMVAK
jgi:FkbM family methyltransferase